MNNIGIIGNKRRVPIPTKQILLLLQQERNTSIRCIFVKVYSRSINFYKNFQYFKSCGLNKRSSKKFIAPFYRSGWPNSRLQREPRGDNLLLTISSRGILDTYVNTRHFNKIWYFVSHYYKKNNSKPRVHKLTLKIKEWTDF